MYYKYNNIINNFNFETLYFFLFHLFFFFFAFFCVKNLLLTYVSRVFTFMKNVVACGIYLPFRFIIHHFTLIVICVVWRYLFTMI